MRLEKVLLALGAAAWLGGCSDPTPRSASHAAAPASATASAAAPTAPLLPAPDVHPAPLAIPPIEASTSPAADPIQQALWQADTQTKEGRRDALIRAEVLLARAHFSPGVIDGQDGANLQNALAAYQRAHGLAPDGRMNQETWAALAADDRPVLTDYVITPEDVKGPFLEKLPTDYNELAKLPAVGFTSPVEALAEKFHMDEGLLKRLNPGADFGAAGTKIVVAALGPDRLPAPVTRIEVDKSLRQVRAYGADGALMAVYPATVGSTERPAPDGTWAVRTVAPNPTYTFDPSRLTFGKSSYGKLTIKPGPNNPVGSTWIDLTVPTYGIHGAPDPRLVGKVASHGCVRLTNWDAAQLGQAVKKGAVVEFVGVEQARPGKAAT
ncbi:MAG: L,D-transpeptidase [Phenylobacterium sp.]